MRQRKWTFYKIVLYLGLISMIGVISLLLYVALNRFDSHLYKTIVAFMLLGACLQTLFYVMCVRLIHHYLPERILPGRLFRALYTVLLIFNSCVAIGLLWLLAVGFSETFLKTNNHIETSDYYALTIVGSYTFTAIYLSAASIVLRRYNRYQVATDEEQWLKQLGDRSSNE